MGWISANKVEETKWGESASGPSQGLYDRNEKRTDSNNTQRKVTVRLSRA